MIIKINFFFFKKTLNTLTRERHLVRCSNRFFLRALGQFSLLTFLQAVKNNVKANINIVLIIAGNDGFGSYGWFRAVKGKVRSIWIAVLLYGRFGRFSSKYVVKPVVLFLSNNRKCITYNMLNSFLLH